MLEPLELLERLLELLLEELTETELHEQDPELPPQAAHAGNLG